MKIKNFSKIMAVVLIAIMMLSMVVSCTKKPPEELPEVSDSFYTHSEENPNIPSKNYEGYEFSFITQGGNSYNIGYLVSDGETGELIADAVYKRNSVLADKYNITFNHIVVSDVLSTVRSQVMSGGTEFDLIIDNTQRLATMAKEGLLLDLNTIDRFDMTKSYWDSNASEQLKIGDHLYFTNCDLNVQELAFVVFFNKQLIKDKNLTSPYEYMENNEWTLDNWAILAKAICDDVNGDGKFTETDRYSNLYEYHNGRMFLYGTGVRATTNGEDGVPKVTLFDTDKTVKVYEKCKEVFKDKASWCINDMSSDAHGYANKWNYARSLFCQDLYLFHYQGAGIIRQFADMESEFGIVPFPKYDSNQENYYAMYPYNCSMVAMPNTLEGEALERAADIIEDLNYYSSIDLKNAWFEKLLKRRYTQDVESEDNLEIVKNNRVYDIGIYYNFGNITSKLLDLDVRYANISSTYKRLQKTIDSDIKKIYKEFGMIS